MSFTKKSTTYFFHFFLLIVLSGCAGPGQSSFQPSWAERTLHKLTLREKIGQMMVFHMNMHFMNEENPKWKELKSLIETDGIGGIHIWFGDRRYILDTFK